MRPGLEEMEYRCRSLQQLGGKVAKCRRWGIQEAMQSGKSRELHELKKLGTVSYF